ncbi:hypothetical protein TSUD_181980 [Trifolium subterraneum]|uniref:Uncharacterized protein n=1 Tax=Trifolium subterraneum TaxID=3900 RepID=A0A2Z6PFP4_TRISU|nr:hypothetical protein TSUD_181980 [Trifolium subterraneum]
MIDLDKETSYKVEIELLKRKLSEKASLKANASKVQVCDFCQENHPNAKETLSFGGDTDEEFMREFIDKRDKVLSEECSALMQRKLPPKLEDPGRFTVPCSNREGRNRESTM